MKKANTTEGNSSPYLHLYGAEGYINGTKILNDICEMYKKYDTTGLVSTARSINTDDVDKILGLTTLELKKQYNIDSYLGGRNIGDSYSFDNQYTPESSLTNTKLTITGNITGYQYTINKRIADDFPYVTIENERVFNMMFANIDTDDKPYWLANQTVTSTYSYVWYSLGVIQTDMDCPSVGHVMLIRSQDKHEIVQKYGVRPVISLKSSTTTEQLKKVSDKTEISWK